MIKAVLFDLDGVLTLDKTGSISTCKYIAEKTGIDYDVLYSANRKYNKDLLLGKVTHNDIWDDYCQEVGYKIDYALLNEAFINTSIDKKMSNLAYKLKEKYKIGLITDNKVDRIDSIIKYNNWNELLDAVCVSAELGCGKDDEKIFNAAMKKLNIKPEECVFIDNQEKNLAVPKKLNMKTIYFDDAIRDYKEIEDLLE